VADLTLELHEELDAFDPAWKTKYPSIGHAALAANVTDLYARWTRTEDGVKYLKSIRGVPDRVGDSRREAEAARAPSSLPFGYDNLGWLPAAKEE